LICLDRNYLALAACKHLWLERVSSGGGNVGAGPPITDMDELDARRVGRKKKKKGKRGQDDNWTLSLKERNNKDLWSTLGGTGSSGNDNEFERNKGSIFGQTTGQSNSRWVECYKCKKVSLSFARL
jgi:hypothetical protein